MAAAWILSPQIFLIQTMDYTSPGGAAEQLSGAGVRPHLVSGLDAEALEKWLFKCQVALSSSSCVSRNSNNQQLFQDLLNIKPGAFLSFSSSSRVLEGQSLIVTTKS